MELPPNSINVPAVTYADMQAALLTQKPTVTKQDLRQYDEFTTNYGATGN
jgi:hypothetical protein